MFSIVTLKRNTSVVQKTILANVQQTVLRNGEGYIDFIRVQLYAGKDRFGKDIRPNYLEDVGPGKYFKTRKQALAYAKWKSIITPNKDRNFLTPNLFINGFFHGSMKLQVKKNIGLGMLEIDSSASFAPDIFRKYGIPPFQLQTENKNAFVENRIRPAVTKYVFTELSRQ